MRILDIVDIEKRLRSALTDIEQCAGYDSEIYEIAKRAHYDLRSAYAEFIRLEIKGLDRSWPTEDWQSAPKDYIPKFPQTDA